MSEITNNIEDGRFETIVDGERAELAYFRRADLVYFVHTEVPRAIEGRGIAAELAKHGLEWARAEGLAVVPRCPYVRSYLDRHPEYQDLVAPEH
ncbi:MAG TPA: GNAT family N-acetyltransferase [Tepidiformaceae bacterium]|nr:GNAT family N-acetyltransferase [Tepidiformaceae bacterium]